MKKLLDIANTIRRGSGMSTAFASWEDDGGSLEDSPSYPDVHYDEFTGRYNACVNVGGAVYQSLGFETAEEALDEALEMRWYYGDEE